MDARRVRLQVDIDVDADRRLSGHIGPDGAAPLEFSGWLGLLQSLDHLIGPADADADVGSRARVSDLPVLGVDGAVL